MIQYILADNQELTSFALEKLIWERQDTSHIRYARHKAELIEALTENPNSIVILDYTLFDFTDEASLLILSERFRLSMWLIVCEDLTTDAMRKMVYTNKSISIVFKDCSLDTFRSAFANMVRGDRYICQRATEVLLCQSQEEKAQGKTLTPTEIEILKGIAQGKTTKEIAYERFSSVHTINTHRKNIFRKLRVNTAHEAIKYAFKAGWVDPAEFYI